jgi:hypothetical protein
MMDIKGDFSGIGKVWKSFITERHRKINIPYKVSNSSVELLTLSEQGGVNYELQVSEFGPVLFSRILELKWHPGGVVSIIFKYCDDNKMPLLDESN